MKLIALKNIPNISVTLDGIVVGTPNKFVAFTKAPDRDDNPSVPHCDTLDIRGAPVYNPSNPYLEAAPPISILYNPESL